VSIPGRFSSEASDGSWRIGFQSSVSPSIAKQRNVNRFQPDGADREVLPIVLCPDAGSGGCCLDTDQADGIDPKLDLGKFPEFVAFSLGNQELQHGSIAGKPQLSGARQKEKSSGSNGQPSASKC
jgi:hypothetical protein